ncbi:pyridoxal phosphate-dependent transferase [Chlamydoabsidia padenii]|nr:pyridoxal phosphate-dependent transferase [Chlamydoabsidia padenii]
MPRLSIHPTRAFQAYQIFAANTNVGKTVFATGLCRAAAVVASSKKPNPQIFYGKPVQTGYPADSDERHVKTFNPSTLQTQTLYTYPDPVSPHIATAEPPPDEQVLAKTKQYMLDCVKKSRDSGAYLFLETAGGIHSPVMSGTSQADFYRALRLPSILVGDGQLGGISTTMSSFESLYIRGYDVPSILLFNHDRYKNHELLSTRLLDKKIDITAVPPPPQPNLDPVQDQLAMAKYYEQLDEYLVPMMERLDLKHQERFDRLASMADKARDSHWWPFTQHNLVKEVTVVDSAHQDHFVTYTKDSKKELEPKEMFDSCASWWTQGLGHGNSKLTLAAAHAAGRYGHVMFPECTNEPSLALAEKILERDTWASRVFVSDNGSTAMEVALKMAMRTAGKRYGWIDEEHQRPVDILGVDGSYHGDTIGTMDACSPNVYNEQVQWYQPRGHWLQPPSVHISKGKTYVQVPKEITGDDQTKQVFYDSVSAVYSVDQQKCDSGLANLYKQYIRKELDGLKQQGKHIGALLMEPVLMGAGGMIFVDPLFQRTLVDVVRQEGKDLLGYTEKSTPSSSSSSSWQGIPVIFDEVFTGWYRLGRASASDFLGVKPDIVAYAKTLTGGLLPLALTVTKESIFDTFISDNKPDCLLHGHSYTAHPMGSAVAKESIDILDTMAADGTWSNYQEPWKQQDGENIWSMWNWETVQQLSHLTNVDSVMTLGSVLAVNLKDDQTKGYGSAVSASVIQKLRHGDYANASGTSINLFARPLGNVIYLMTSQVTTPADVKECERILLSTLMTGGNKL